MYEFWVQAETAVGPGPFSDSRQFTTPEDGMIIYCYIYKWLFEFNPLNATGVYIRLIFTSRERERRIYTPAIYSGPYRANRRSLAAVRGKTLFI